MLQSSDLDKKEPIKVAVIDTGFDFDSTWGEHLNKFDSDGYQLKKPKICKEGSKDFTGTDLKDRHGHGTHVAGIIAKFAEDSNYCLIILKFFDPKLGKTDNLRATSEAIKHAIDLKVDIINYSGGGLDKSTPECNLIKQALDIGITIVAAAGNEKSNINKSPYYPAMCDERVVVVQNTDDKGNIIESSNFTDKRKGSRELVGEKGLYVLSLLPDNKIGMMTGTSQATPTHVGKLIKKMKRK